VPPQNRAIYEALFIDCLGEWIMALILDSEGLASIANRVSPFISIGVVIMTLVPILILGEASYFTVHDNLDSEFVYKRILVESGQAWDLGSQTVVQRVMNGIPRTGFRSGLDVSLLLFVFFSPHVAYILNYLLVHAVAFVGMVLLLKAHFLTDHSHRWIVWTVATAFASIPFYSQFGLSVAGQPLLLLSFLNILMRKQTLVDFIIIVTFPFYSHIVLVAPFIIGALAVIGGMEMFRLKEMNWSYCIAVVVLVLVYGGVELQMIKAVFAESFVSHRTVWDRWNDLDLMSNVKRAVDVLVSSQYHAGSIPTVVVWACGIAALIQQFFKRKTDGQLLGLVLFIVAVGGVAGFHDWIVYYLGAAIPLLRSFNITRLCFLLPLAFMLLLAIALREMVSSRRLQAFGWLAVCAQIFFTLNMNAEFKINLKVLAGRSIEEPTYRAFFAPDLLSSIDRHIGRPKEDYRVVSIGIHPSVAQFNGFYTLDSYQTTYPLEYKRQFRRIMEKELAKSEVLRDYYDGWGNRCYIFVSELGKSSLYGKTSGKVVNHLELNTSQLRAMGGEYVLSAVEILNYTENDLSFDGKFSDSSSYWDIYLYKVLQKPSTAL
jgi:hypothetical protein